MSGSEPGRGVPNQNRWPPREAADHFSELVRRAHECGPQYVSEHGQKGVVVLSEAEFARLKGGRPRFVAFMRSSPLNGVELDLARDKSPMREVGI